MDALSSFIGCDVYAGGKVIGRVSDFFIDLKNKCVCGITCLSNTGIIRTRFYVEKSGILHFDRNGVVVDRRQIKYNKSFLEEYSVITPKTDFSNGSMGNVYIEPDTLSIKIVSVKRSFFDDLIFGREFFDIDEITLTEKGIVKRD